MSQILVTGAAGFIGYHVAERLLADGHAVVGLDIVNDYYDPALKRARLARLAAHASFHNHEIDLADDTGVAELFASVRPSRVIHLAAQAGVRYSLEHPRTYVQSNLVGFLNVLEGCRHHGVEHLVYASSSSVYGSNTNMPFTEHRGTDHPLSLYAATKKANEMMAHSYSSLYDIPTTGLRFFTVYGPWGRPDMALFLFAKAMEAGRPIDVFNRGDMSRDFTYIDDVVEGVVRLMDRVPAADPDWDSNAPDPASSRCPYRVYNIGNNSPVGLMAMIEALEEALGQTADKNFLPLQPGDVPATWADASDLIRDTGYAPDTPIEVGVRRFVAWYREYHG